MRFEALLRTPPSLDDPAATRPLAEQLLTHRGDGELLARDSGAEDGHVVVAFEADDAATAHLHAQAIAERVLGCEVVEVTEAGAA